MKIDESTIEEIRNRLIDYDPEIVEIVQFGSSIYLPDLANDLDLLVFTKEKKGDCFDYLKELEGLDLPPKVDLILHRPGEPLDGLTLGVLGANKLIYGEGKFLKESTKDYNPSFDEAWVSLETGKKYMEVSKEAEGELLRDRHRRDAFNALSHAARMASLIYLAKEGLGWRGIEKELPGDLGKKFHVFLGPYMWNTSTMGNIRWK